MIDLDWLPLHGCAPGPRRRGGADVRPAVLVSPDGGQLAIPAWRQGWHWVLVSACDAWAAEWFWYVSAGGYVVANVRTKQRYLHRLVAWLRKECISPAGVETALERYWLRSVAVVDHLDHDRLNNTRKNLRLTDQTGNSLNSSPRYGNTVTGVTWDEAKQRWQAKFEYQGRTIYCGRYATPEQAARVIERRRAQVVREHQQAVRGDLATATMAPPEPDEVPF